MSREPSVIAQALLEAQVACMAAQLSGEDLRAIVEEEVDAALAAVRKLRLQDLASRAAVKHSLRRLLREVAPGPAVAALVVDTIAALHADSVHERVTPAELFDDEQVARVVDQALSMTALREAVIRGVIASPAYTSFASDLLYRGIRGYLAENAVTRSIPGAQSMMKLGRAALSKATPGLESAIEDGIKKYIAQAVKLTSEHSVELLLGDEATVDLRRTVLEFWRRLRGMRIAEFRREIGLADARRIGALAYAMIDRLRGTDYVATLVDSGVEVFFDRYQSKPLAELLAEFGIGRELLVEEILRHAAPAARHLHKKKLLEPLLRRRLAAFYQSAVALDILAAAGGAAISP